MKIGLDPLTKSGMLPFYKYIKKEDNKPNQTKQINSIQTSCVQSCNISSCIFHQALSCIFPIPSCSLYPLQPFIYPHPTSPSPLHPVCSLPGTDKVSWQGVGVLSFASLSGNPGSCVHATSLEQ